MNEETPNPFDTVGDAPVEARIVAWVLGEASAFEAAELERLCAERPELLVFRRRMTALHGLLGEAESAQPDAAWKLPPAKRAALASAFGEVTPIRSEPTKERAIRRSGRRALWAIAACVAVAFVLQQMVRPYWVEQVYHAPEKRVDFMPPAGAGGEAYGAGAEDVNFRGYVSADEEGARNNVVAIPQSRSSSQDERAKAPAKLAGSVDVVGGSRFALRTPFSGKAQTAQESARQAQLARKPQQEVKRVSAEGAVSVPALDAPANFGEMSSLSSLGVGGMSGGGRSGLGSGGLGSGGMAGGGSGFGQATPASPGAPEPTAALDALAAAPRARAKSERRDGASEGFTRNGLPVIGTLYSGVAMPMEQKSDSSAAPPVLDEKNSSLADRENVRRQDATVESERLLLEGRDAYAKGDYDEASAKYKSSLDKLPAAGVTDDVRKQVAQHAADSDVARAQQNRKVGNYAEAEQLLKGAKELDPTNEYAQRELDLLNDPIRTNPAFTSEHGANVDKVRRGLYVGEGNMNLGKYDDAKKSYEEVLRADPTNASARRGLEKVAAAKSDYYRAAYDQTRAELLNNVDKAWELDGAAKEKDAAEEPAPKKMESAPEIFRLAEDARNLGNYEDAKRAYGDVLKADPTNAAARLGLEQVEGLKADFDRSSNFGGRAELLAEVDGKQDNSVPAESDAAPAPPSLPELMEEIPAAEDPYSTFSLNVSDASFQVAQAALAKGERPDPADVKPEQFYNAVDYGDPAPAAGQPVAATIEQAAHPIIPGRNLVRVALRVGSTGRSAAQPLRLTLLVDQSGSMVREDRRAAMDHALTQLGTLLAANDQVTLIGFSRTPRLLADAMPGDQGGKLNDLVNQAANEGGTNLEEALKLGAEKAAAHLLVGAQNRVVLFTDGAANLGNADPARLAEQIKALRQQGIAFDVAGIGADGLNDRLLSELARNGNGRYYVVGSEANDSFARQLAGAFRPAAENVKVQVIFNPQRVGGYKLIGFEKDRLKTEDFRNDAVDAAELAADEAGVAIYQVEPRADGTGELGEVSVRFRDAASGEMVERAWTLPYEVQASAFDRATPSMQLAGLAMLAAEKLRGGPLGAAIDFNQLAASEAFVKQFYGNSPRVADMLRVIDALK